jgi:acyl dehydratase
VLDRKWIGHSLPTSVFPVERSRLRFFAKAIGETNPIYVDEQAAHAAGHPDLPAPPTFLFTAEMDSDLKMQWLQEAQVPLAKVLHGEQSFTYHGLVYAGDTVSVTTRVTDIYDKKNGALEFIVMDTEAVNQRGDRVAESRGIIVVRN